MTVITDQMILLREAIEQVLSQATEPLSTFDIARKPAVFELGLDPGYISSTMYQLYGRKHQAFPLKRIPARPGQGPGVRWEYYNPKVVKLAPSPKVVKEPAPVNAVNPQVFEFNPVEFNPPAEVTAVPVPVPVPVPAGVKSITLTIGGVSIKIELGG